MIDGDAIGDPPAWRLKMEDHTRWIEAAKTVVMNPHSQVLCPNCGVAFLTVEDEWLDDEHMTGISSVPTAALTKQS